MSCESALDGFAARTFSQWQPLPTNCLLAQVTAKFPLLNDGVGTGRIGERSAQYRMVVSPRYPRPVRAWLEGNNLLMLDAEYPDPENTLAAEIEALGEPEARLDCWWDVLRLQRAEWVFASRGLAAFVNPDNRIVLRLLVFPAASLAEYERKFRIGWRSIKFRKR
jgi:hypothetical protein